MALGAVDDGELGVQTQVNEHATDCRSPQGLRNTLVETVRISGLT